MTQSIAGKSIREHPDRQRHACDVEYKTRQMKAGEKETIKAACEAQTEF